jgi:flagellin-like protein
MKRTKNDEAVSPVIGVILMVAITVILAAVIAAFVFGSVGEIPIKKEIAVTASQTHDTSSGDYRTTVTFHGGNDFRDLSALEATIRVPGGTPDSGFTWTYASMGTAPVPVGTTGTINLGSPGADHVIVVATFVDGSRQLILDTFV